MNFFGGVRRILAMAYIRTYKRKNSTYVQIVYKDGRRISRIRHLGTSHNQIELDLLVNKAEELLIHPEQKTLFVTKTETPSIVLENTASKLLYGLILKTYDMLGFSSLNDEIFQNLAIARIIEPTSKLDSIRIFEEIGIKNISKDQIHRTLAKVSTKNYRKQISQICVSHRKIQSSSVLLYDVTTLYFETLKEDETRIPGLSKERRLEPQIIIGLLVDQYGFPLSLQMFSGNTAETKTIIPVLKEFRQEYDIKNLTVVADAAMLNRGNIEKLVQNNFKYILGSRQHKMPFAIEEYLKTHENPVDLDITENIFNDGSRAIYQYSLKRAKLDLKNLEKQIEKAQRIINGTGKLKKNKFVKIDSKNKRLDLQRIEKSRKLAGFKGYITNLDLPAQNIIKYYHDLWHVEASFRMSKSDLKARPVFHRKEESIDAHLTIVMTALAIAKAMEEKSGMAIKKIVKLLKPLRTGTLLNKNSCERMEIEPQIPKEYSELISNLSRGY